MISYGPLILAALLLEHAVALAADLLNLRALDPLDAAHTERSLEALAERLLDR